MGYTHYWTFKKAPKGAATKTEATYKKALIECQKVVKAYYAVNGGISGFTAHTKLGQYGGLAVNGKGEEGHEAFVMPEHYNDNFERSSFGFCKTAQKPYDVVVVACLAVLKHRLGDLIEVRSDGYPSDWERGVNMASNILKRDISNPLGE